MKETFCFSAGRDVKWGWLITFIQILSVLCFCYGMIESKKRENM